MPPRAAIIEEFDDDVDLPLPSRPLPDRNGRGPLLMEVDDADNDDDNDDADDDDTPGLAGMPSAADFAQFAARIQQQAQAGPASPRVVDMTPYKKWTCIYPIYIDAKQPYATGARRVTRAKAVWHPLSKDIAEAAVRLGLAALNEAQKAHPRDWENPGRVRVQWKKDGRLVNPAIKSKKQLLEMISFQIQCVKSENVPTEPYAYPPVPIPPTQKPAKSRTLTQGGKGKVKAAPVSESTPRAPKRPGRPLPVPPEPQPSLTARLSPLSPALPSGVLLDAVKAGMTAQQEQGQIGAGPGGGVGKGKRKIVRVRQ
ncbi:signal recognition particle, SRP19 subunit [Vararia minispora EC-137]|uniref:Signal recognition particle, SRP19 subunit n=1 Tax=Vararia minispora EC-137 TaxID=1314806 RepID=A0ACB8QI53_9AGAM|nr:signal recognition particle, SRP19 subunit [Vararia minispora EC-137]